MYVCWRSASKNVRKPTNHHKYEYKCLRFYTALCYEYNHSASNEKRVDPQHVLSSPAFTYWFLHLSLDLRHYWCALLRWEHRRLAHVRIRYWKPHLRGEPLAVHGPLRQSCLSFQAAVRATLGGGPGQDVETEYSAQYYDCLSSTSHNYRLMHVFRPRI